MKINQIVAIDEEFGIGQSKLEGKLPWNLKEEFQHFLSTATKTEVRKIADIFHVKTYEKT